MTYKSRYENYIGGEYVPPTSGQYFENVTPVNGQVFCEVARGNAADVELALDAAHNAADAWGKTTVTERSNILLKIADRMEANLEALAVAETWDNGKPIRETVNAPCGRRKARSARSLLTSLPTTTTSLSASWRRSSRGTSRSSWPSGSSLQRSPRATAWC